MVEGIRNALRLQPDRPLDAHAITDGLTGGPVKDIDLVIRTSGEMRLSGFFPWQAAHAEIYVSRKLWQAFTERDFARALTHFAAARSRRSR